MSRVLVTGAFRQVRHPLYLASILTYFGLTVSTVSLFSLALFVGIFLFHNYVASYEEKLLDERFGEEYRRYKRKTGSGCRESVKIVDPGYSILYEGDEGTS